MKIVRFKARIGHIYPLRRRIGHIYPLTRLGIILGDKSKAKDSISKNK